MANEINDLTYNNVNITFNAQTNNTATSDELEASAIYQTKMGTAYSRSKGVIKAINAAGISLILTAAAIRTGSLISNAYVLNPPSISKTSYVLEDHTFKASFTVSNIGEYQIDYYLFINNSKEPALTDDCSESKEYLVTYEGLKDGDSGHFYIEFTNTVDYKKVIETYTFNVEE